MKTHYLPLVGFYVRQLAPFILTAVGVAILTVAGLYLHSIQLPWGKRAYNAEWECGPKILGNACRYHGMLAPTTPATPTNEAVH